MTRSILPRGFALLGLSLVVSSCSLFGGDDKQGSFTISVNAAALTLQQSVIDTVTVTVARSSYSEPVSLALTGAPSGVTATFTPSTLASPAQTSLLVLTASGTAAVGAATINVTANGNGVTEQSTSFQLTIGVTGSYTLGSQGTAVAAQGGAATATVLINRSGGHADNVALSVTGAPSGVSASVTPSSTSDAGATLAITATAGAAIGTYPLTVTGVAGGLTNQTKVISLDVVAAPSTTSTSMAFCSTRIPLWFAIRNEGYGWQTVSPAGATFTFNATDKLAVAYSLSFSDHTEAHVLYVSRVELAGWSDRDCFGPKSISGAIVGATTGQSGRVSMGASVASATQASPGFTLTGVADRSLDVVGTKGTFVNLSSGSQLITPDALLLRRAQNPANNTSLGNLDFAGGESFAPQSNTITLGNTLSGDAFFTASTFWTNTNTYGTLSSAQPAAGAATMTAYSVPAAKMLAGDIHELYIEANQPGTATYFTGRSLAAYLGTGTDHTETFGPLISTPTASVLSNTPYVRFLGQLGVQAEYATAVRFVYVEETNTAARLIYVWMTSAYLGATPVGTWDVVIPDFTGVSGFNATWMLQGSDLIYQVDALSGPGAVLFNSVPAAGQVVKGALRVQYTQPGIAPGMSAFRSAGGTREVRSAVQYLRR